MTFNELIAQAGLTVDAVFIPQSQSRNAKEKHRSLNWRVSIMRNGRALVSGDYSAGCAHCPAYKLSVKEAGGRDSIMRDAMIEHECETGRTYTRFGTMGVAITPDSASVIAAFFMDADAINEQFADWCANLGCSDDSIKARATYDECLAHAIALRAGIGAEMFEKMREAAREL